MKTILVQMTDSKWTKSAVRAACDLAREQGAEVILAKMLPASFLNWRGMDVYEYMFTDSECEDIYAYEDIAREARVPIRSMVFKYDDLAKGLVEAAEAVNASEVVAPIPHETLPLGGWLELSHLDRVVTNENRQFYTVIQPAAVVSKWKPYVEVVR